MYEGLTLDSHTSFYQKERESKLTVPQSKLFQSQLQAFENQYKMDDFVVKPAKPAEQLKKQPPSIIQVEWVGRVERIRRCGPDADVGWWWAVDEAWADRCRVSDACATATDLRNPAISLLSAQLF